jgi:hypothetical protein
MITFTTAASVSGIAQEGQLLTALGEVDDPMATITYQWQENINGTWTDIPGATSQTFTVVEADEGNALRAVETATEDGHLGDVDERPTAAMTDITLAFTSDASIDNTAPRVGETLSAVNGSLNDTDAAVTSYQWQRSINSTWTDIPGATSQTYTVVMDDGANQLHDSATTRCLRARACSAKRAPLRSRSRRRRTSIPAPSPRCLRLTTAAGPWRTRRS